MYLITAFDLTGLNVDDSCFDWRVSLSSSSTEQPGSQCPPTGDRGLRAKAVELVNCGGRNPACLSAYGSLGIFYMTKCSPISNLRLKQKPASSLVATLSFRSSFLLLDAAKAGYLFITISVFALWLAPCVCSRWLILLLLKKQYGMQRVNIFGWKTLPAHIHGNDKVEDKIRDLMHTCMLYLALLEIA